MSTTRRKFLQTLGSSSSLLIAGLPALADQSKVQTLLSQVSVSANDKIRIALIGSGIIRSHIFHQVMHLAGHS